MPVTFIYRSNFEINWLSLSFILFFYFLGEFHAKLGFSYDFHDDSRLSLIFFYSFSFIFEKLHSPHDLDSIFKTPLLSFSLFLKIFSHFLLKIFNQSEDNDATTQSWLFIQIDDCFHWLKLSYTGLSQTGTLDKLVIDKLHQLTRQISLSLFDSSLIRKRCSEDLNGGNSRLGKSKKVNRRETKRKKWLRSISSDD